MKKVRQESADADKTGLIDVDLVARDTFLKELDSTTFAERRYPKTPEHMPVSIIA
ncbi:hypothetical protein H2LOC_020610 (plasmid) [Methylocystis heyeri]|uniref:Uncharacterized protein n=1 Tax=Methylocystis heyeri TaxID=391905 RepID=A0A6B8KKS7_9HYPH|nr:hypothetical protein H2LOC_020610 [Methylocystis heyeri]